MTKLIAYDGALHRRERLAKALRIAREILSLSESQANLLIHDVRDQRGLLIVNWSAAPTERQCSAFSTAWELVGEKPDRVQHRTAGQGLVEWDE